MKLLQRRKENWDNDFVPNILLLPYEIDTEHYAYCKYCKQDLSIQHGGRDEHTYTTKQFKSAKSTTYQELQN